MIISEKQVLELIGYVAAYMMMNPTGKMSSQAAVLIQEIEDQQSTELKVISDLQLTNNQRSNK